MKLKEGKFYNLYSLKEEKPSFLENIIKKYEFCIVFNDMTVQKRIKYSLFEINKRLINKIIRNYKNINHAFVYKTTKKERLLVAYYKKNKYNFYFGGLEFI